MTENKAKKINTVCCYGTGVIGGGWVAHFLRNGLNVIAYDPNPKSEAFLKKLLEDCWPVLEQLGMAENASLDNLTIAKSHEQAIDGVQFIQESVVENEAIKMELLAKLDCDVDPSVIISSSSSGFLAANLRSQCQNRGGRVIVGHPFNPPYLIPLVEVVGGEGCDSDIVDAAVEFYDSLGGKAVILRNEIEGYIANRIQDAVFKEVLYLVQQDIASVKDIDDAITYGPALRWALMGPGQVSYLACQDPEKYGDLFDQLAEETKHYVAPNDVEISSELRAQYIREIEEVAGGTKRDALMAKRDGGIVSILRTLDSL
jgi:carnitine 3-dehydrogenase